MAERILHARALTASPLEPSFEEALQEIALRIGAMEVHVPGTKITAFKTNYSSVLDRVTGGSVEVVTRGRQRFLILAEEQARALVANTENTQTVAEAFAGLPSMPASSERPRAMSTATADHYRLPR